MSFLKIEKMDLLIAVYIFCVAVSELMGAKTFPVFDWGWVRLNASVAVFVIPLIFTINDVVTEVFGKERARSIVRSSLVVIFLMLLYSLLVTSLPPSKRFAASEASYDAVFGLSARISAASLIAFAVSDFLDIYVFVWLREKFGKGKLWLRNNVSNFVSQFIDSATFLVLAFWALDQGFSSNFNFIVGLLIPYWLLRCALSVLETPLVYLGVKWLRSEKK